MWWERVAKTQIRKLFIIEGTERRMDDNTLENFYHACLYDPSHRVEGIATVNRIKAKIVKLYSALDNRVVKSRHAAK